MRVEFSEPAQNDLAQIGRYIASDNPARAITFVDDLEQACERLTEYPERFEVIRHIGGHDIRRMVFGNYLILYQIEKNCIFVLRDVNSAMDIDEVLL